MRYAPSLAAASLLAVACSSTTEGEVHCAIGELRGTWQITYAEKDGNCGPLAAETAVLTDQTTGSSACTYATQQVSSDKCRMDMDFTCPLTGVQGSQHWVGSLRQVADDRLAGSMTLQASGGVLCRSTYDVTWQRQ